MGIKDMQCKDVFLYLMTSATQILSKWTKCPSPQQRPVTKLPSSAPCGEGEKNYTIIIPNNNSFQINSSLWMPKSNKGKPIPKDKADLENRIWPYSNMWHFGCTQKSHRLLFKAWQIDGQLHISFPQNRTINHLWLELQQERKWWKNSQNLMGWMAATLQIPRFLTSKTYKSDLCSFAPMKTFCKAPQLRRPSAKPHSYEDLLQSSTIIKTSITALQFWRT